MELRESIEAIADCADEVLGRFYEVFLARSPTIKEYFEGVDLEAQTVMLSMVLIAVKEYPILTRPAKNYLRLLGLKHRARGIPRELYDDFVASMLTVVGDFHADDWHTDLANQWHAALDKAVALMFEGYMDRNRVSL